MEQNIDERWTNLKGKILKREDQSGNESKDRKVCTNGRGIEDHENQHQQHGPKDEGLL
jgi:hypothetical protein